MPIRFEEYGEKRIPAVQDFNRRIAEALDGDLHFPESPLESWVPKGSHPRIFQEGFLALDGETVRGGYFLKHQDFVCNRVRHRVSCYRIPLSEGIANRTYASLGLQLIRHALARQPLLFSLGMGSPDRPLPQMQKALGWGQYTVPFYFKVIDGSRFLRHIAPLRVTQSRRLMCDLAAWSGAGSVGSAVWRLLRRPCVPDDVVVQQVDQFAGWADEIWGRANSQYSLIAIRDRDACNTLYPPHEGRFLRWKIMRGKTAIGWAVALDTAMKGHKQFGDMRVATIVDGMADPSDAGLVIAAVTRELERRGPDLIISNQMHHAWGQALSNAGFLAGRSNFIFSASKALSEEMAPFETRVKDGHINRGDGDGPIHL